MSVRRPDFAGSWYPDTEQACRAMFAEFERACVQRKATTPAVGGIVPHAGWVFSGRIAYNVIQQLAAVKREGDTTVVLFGGHLRPSSPITVMDRGEFWTPFGNVLIDEALGTAVCQGRDVVRETPDRHTPDNTIELQVPMIRHLLPGARLLPIEAPPRAEMLEMAASVVQHAAELNRQLVVLGSTDLTHYGPNYGWAPSGHGDAALRWVKEENDPRWIERACALDPEGMIEEARISSNACCPGAAAAAARCARALGRDSGELLAYSTSADVRPDASFVGYAGILL